MPTPVREQIILAVVATLGGVAGATVRRNSADPAEAPDTIDVYDTGGQEPLQAGGGIEEYLLEVPIDLFAADGPALNTLEAKAWQVLAANASLGGVAIDVARIRQEGGALDRVDGHPNAISRAMPVSVRYWTREGDPYSVGP